MSKTPTYCGECGSELTVSTVSQGFDRHTGDEKLDSILHCPFRMLDTVGYNRHDGYVFRQGLFGSSWRHLESCDYL